MRRILETIRRLAKLMLRHADGFGREALQAAIDEINIVLRLLDRPDASREDINRRVCRILILLDAGGFFGGGKSVR